MEYIELFARQCERTDPKTLVLGKQNISRVSVTCKTYVPPQVCTSSSVPLHKCAPQVCISTSMHLLKCASPQVCISSSVHLHKCAPPQMCTFSGMHLHKCAPCKCAPSHGLLLVIFKDNTMPLL